MHRGRRAPPMQRSCWRATGGWAITEPQIAADAAALSAELGGVRGLVCRAKELDNRLSCYAYARAHARRYLRHPIQHLSPPHRLWSPNELASNLSHRTGVPVATEPKVRLSRKR